MTQNNRSDNDVVSHPSEPPNNSELPFKMTTYSEY